MMLTPKVRLAVTATLFLAWLGWLAYLVVNTRNPVVLSRPQFLVSSMHVIALVKENQGWPVPEVVVKKVAWSADDRDKALEETPIAVADLSDCGAGQGWAGPGEYILPLLKRTVGQRHFYLLAPLPPSPGYFAPSSVELIKAEKNTAAVIALVGQVAGLAPTEAEAVVGNLPKAIKKNLSQREAQKILEQFKNLGAEVEIREEARIYPATAGTLRQLEEIEASRN